MKISEIVNMKISESQRETEVEFLYRKLEESEAKVIVAKSFLKGLKDTPDDVTIGTLRSFIDANYNNISK